MENNAWFWLMGNNWPLQKVQPLGGKFQLMIFISPRNVRAISGRNKNHQLEFSTQRLDLLQRPVIAHQPEPGIVFHPGDHVWWRWQSQLRAAEPSGPLSRTCGQ